MLAVDIGRLLFLIGCCVLVLSCGHGLVKVPTGAMLPTIPIDSYVAWQKDAYSSGEVKRFDLVVHTLPLDEKSKRLGLKEDDRYIFRIIGLSGEKIEIKRGQVFVNGEKLEEPFAKVESNDDFGPVVVPDGEFFLLGDNRPESNDSRFWSRPTIGKNRLVGKVVKIL